MNNPMILIGLGVCVGVFSGLMGLGDGAVMIPIMALALHMTQPQAHGTSLAVMIPPVTLPAVIHYYRNGNVNLGIAAWMALGVLMGTFVGAYLANIMPKDTLKLVFGFILIYVAAYTIFGKENLQRTTILSVTLVLVAMAMFFAVRLLSAVPPRAS